MTSSTPATAPANSNGAALETYHAQLTQQLNAYYDKTQLLAVIRVFIQELTQRFQTTRLVPLNIYTALLMHVRLAEISATELLVAPQPRDLKALTAALPPQELLLFDPRDGRSATLLVEKQVATFKSQSPASPSLAVWGLRRVLESIPYSSGWQRGMEEKYELLAAMAWLSESETTDESCVVRCVGALVGSELFFPAGARETFVVEVERHVIVAGEQLELAMAVFARQLIRSLFETTKKNTVISFPGEDGENHLMLLGTVAVEISTHKDHKAKESTLWTLERVTANRQAFVTAVKLALVNSGRFSIDLLYEWKNDSRVSSNNSTIECANTSHVLRCCVVFFFHFDCETSLPIAKAKPATTPNPVAATTTTSRSFVAHSKLHDSGLFFTPHSAYDLTRRLYDQHTRDEDTMTGDTNTQRSSTSSSPLDDLIYQVRRSTRSSVETRHWLGVLSSTLAFRLACGLAQIDKMLHVLRSIPTTDESVVWRLLSSSLQAYDEAINQLVEDAAIGRSSSLLLGLQDLLRELCCLPQERATLDSLFERLQTSREAIHWIYSGASRDFCLLVSRTTTTTDGQTPIALAPSADLRVDISAAIEQRRFPPTIVAETVFAQYLVETQVDVALERSLVNTVACGLPPNPFVPFCGHLRVFALQYYMANTESLRKQHTPRREIKRVDGVGFVLQTPSPLGVLVSANERLLSCLHVSSVSSLHDFLTNRHIYRSTAYHPSKASYSARIFSSLLVDDPLLTISTDPLNDQQLIQSLEIVEHIVIDGNDHALALWFFADAVRRDVQRLLQIDQVTNSVGLVLLDPQGELLTTVELQEIQTFEQLLTEATPKRCMLQVQLPPIVSTEIAESPVVQLVTKSYAFHYVCSYEFGTGTSPATTAVSDRLLFRLKTFGVFTDLEGARIALASVHSRGGSIQCELPRQATYAQRALERNDTVLLRFLNWITQPPSETKSSAESSLSAPQQHHQLPVLLLQLFDLENAVWWLLQHVLSIDDTPAAALSTTRSHCAAVVPRLVQALQRIVLPVVECMGIADAVRVKELIASMDLLANLSGQSATPSPQSTGETWLQSMEHNTRRMHVLVQLVRFSLREAMV